MHCLLLIYILPVLPSVRVTSSTDVIGIPMADIELDHIFRVSEWTDVIANVMCCLCEANDRQEIDLISVVNQSAVT